MSLVIKILVILCSLNVISFAAAPSSCFIDARDLQRVVNDSRVTGPNGHYCRGSGYNCKLRASGGQEVRRENRQSSDYWDKTWRVRPGCHVRDGHGQAIIKNTRTRMSFNYGLKRWFFGKDFAYARSTSNSSSGWYPISCIKEEDEFRRQAYPQGYILAQDSGLSEMACYEIKSSVSKSLSEKKVVYGTTSANEKAGDYLPKKRVNGKVSANLAFSVPGCALGAPAIDHYFSGTKFQRIDVPTATGLPSLDIPLWKPNFSGEPATTFAGSMKFIYGYIVSNHKGTKKRRYGWMAYDALKRSSGCE